MRSKNFERIYAICLAGALLLTVAAWFGTKTFQGSQEQQRIDEKIEQAAETQIAVQDGQSVSLTGAGSWDQATADEQTKQQHASDVYLGWEGTLEAKLLSAKLYTDETGFAEQEGIAIDMSEYDYLKSDYGFHPMLLVVEFELTNVDAHNHAYGSGSATSQDSVIQSDEVVRDAEGNVLSAEELQELWGAGSTGDGDADSPNETDDENAAEKPILPMSAFRLAVNGRLRSGSTLVAVDPMTDAAINEYDHYWDSIDLAPGETKVVRLVYPLIAADEFDAVLTDLEARDEANGSYTVREFIGYGYGYIRYGEGDTLTICAGSRDVATNDSASEFKAAAYTFDIKPQIVS